MTAGARRFAPLAAAALVAAAGLLAYLPGLDNGFHWIDDHRHVANGAGLAPFPNHHFRPVQEGTFRLLWLLGGREPFAYHLAGLLCHLGASLALWGLARRLLRGEAGALAAGLLFATLAGPAQAVLWIGANLGVQAVACGLLAALLWLRFLAASGAKERWIAYGGALLSAALALGCKESGVQLLAWLLVVQLWRRDATVPKPATLLAAWLPLAALGLLTAWRATAISGGAGLEVAPLDPLRLLDRLLRSLGHLPLPLAFRRDRPGLRLLGLLLLAAPLLGSYLVYRKNGRQAPAAARLAAALAALALLLAGHAAIVPVEPEIIGERSYYEAAPGFALLGGVLLAQAAALLPRLRPLPWLVLLLFAAAQAAAIHRQERWKYDLPSRHVEALTAATGRALAASAGRPALFLDPPLPDLRDFAGLVRVWHAAARERPAEHWLDPRDGALPRLLAARPELKPWRWRAPAWVPHGPDGEEWLRAWKPGWWPAGLDHPSLSPLLRALEVAPPGGGR